MSAPITQEFLNGFVRRYAAAWTAKEAASNPLSEFITADVHWVDPMLPQPAKNSAEVVAFFEGFLSAFPDLSCEVLSPPCLSADGKVAMLHWRLVGTMTGPLSNGAPATGKSLSLTGVDRWEFRDGRICRYQAFYDLFGCLKQLGLLPG